MQKKIDCHTHIINPQIRAQYFSQTSGYALVMQFLPQLMENPWCVKTVCEDSRLFLCPAIDIHRPIAPQLAFLLPHLDAWKIVGLKVYLSYQKGQADDPSLYPIYAFAKEHALSITFHTGLCSLVLPGDNDVDGSDAKYIAKAAEQFPDVNFIAAHMDDPRISDCLSHCITHNNMYTDFSGIYETGTKEGSDILGTITQYKEVIRAQKGAAKKILYGTDFCPPLNLTQIQEYDQTLSAIFSEEERDNVTYKNCINAFPRLRQLEWRK